MGDETTATVPSADNPLDRPADGLTPDAAGPTAGGPGDGADALRPPAPPGYELLELVGLGGMGVVYRAHELALNRQVAVKVLHDQFPADGAAAARFAEEAQITGQLQHPGVPPIHRVGALPDGRPFLVMKFIKGHTLDELLKDRPDPAADRGRFLAIFEQVCQAVAYAHAHKVIHRDLKPANVMVGSFAEVQVMDWGLAKPLIATPARPARLSGPVVEATEIHTLRGSEGSFTQAGSVLGTPAFMPPEQAGGEADRIDERADVFGLGAILCVILTGKPPYVAGASEAVRLMAIRGQLDECRTRLGACGAEPELVALCERCLVADPVNRPRDAREVARAVAGLRAAADERARQAELDRVRTEGELRAAGVRAAEQWKRRKVQAALGLTFTAMVLLAGAFAWRQDRQAAERRADAARAEGERAARRAATESSVATALEDARRREDEAWGLTDLPERMRAAADLALAAVGRAEGFAATGDPSSDTRAALAAARAGVDELDRHARLLTAGERTMAEFGVTFDRPRLLRNFRDAFREFGWDLTHEPADGLADRVAASRARDKVLGLLFDWRFQAADPRQGNPAEGEKLEAALRLVRRRAGGLLARWQDFRDRGDLPGLVELAADPGVTTLAPELLLELGRNLRAARQTDAVLALLRRAADRYPTHVWVRHDLFLACREHRPPLWTEALGHAAAAATLRPDSAVFQNQVADALRQLGDYARAADADRRAVRLAPGAANLHNSLGVSLSRLRDLDGAAASFRTATELDPGYALAHFNLGIALRAKGDLGGAAAAYRQAIRLDSRDARPQRELAWLLAAGPDWLRNGRNAIENATRACELTGWKDPVPIDTLAAGYAEAGEFDKAVEYEKMALALPAFEKGAAGLAARKRLDLYSQKKAYRDPLLARLELAPRRGR